MSSFQDPVLQPGSKILVTGVSGFVGSHVADQLLSANYKVRGTSRDVEKNAWLVPLFERKYGPGKFELACVPDLTQNGAFDKVLQGIQAHMIAPQYQDKNNRLSQTYPASSTPRPT
jgi:nucleoside-diphosphate-sugar epimerase